MGIYTHAWIDTILADALQLENIYENKVVYNTLKFHWQVAENMISGIPYEVSLFYFLEDTTV